MNRYRLLLLASLFLFEQASAESLSGSNDILQEQGAENLVAAVRESSKTEEGVASLALSNELHYMGKDGGVVSPPPNWTVTYFTEGTGVQLSLKVGHYYFHKSPKFELGLESCPRSGTSSGTAYKVNSNGSSVSFAWSCGSMGCSYRAKLGNGNSPCI